MATRIATATVLAIALAWLPGVLPRPPGSGLVAPAFAVESAAPRPTGAPLALTEVARQSIPTDPGKPASHSSSIVHLPEPQGPGSVLAYWFSGTRESAPDVEILSSRYDPARNAWSAPRSVLDRHALALEMDVFVRRLGNPVGWVDADRRIHLFVVATGLGGWAASRIVHLRSDDGGARFRPLRVLPLSPWFNTSHLVRAPATPLADRGALVPLYFEIGIKYPLALRLSPAGEPLELVRMSNDGATLQPSIVALDGDRAVALLRDHSDARSLKLTGTQDGGRSWADLGRANLPNPNASVVAARLPDGTLVAALNPAREGRTELALAVSRDGRDWRIERTLEAGSDGDEFSYPSMLVAGDALHVTYTYKRQAIMHRVFRLASDTR
jgi:predicted neuraminidase